MHATPSSSVPSAAPAVSATARTLVIGLFALAALLLASTAMPKWLLFLATMAAANGLVSLGIVLLMRSGVVSFGQGLVFAVGGYTAALAFGKLGISDALLLALAGGMLSALVAAPFAWPIARYRGIFFAMLSLALSMVLYGLLVKSEAMGGSDGFNMGRPTLFGLQATGELSSHVIYAATVSLATIAATLARIYCDSTRGLLALAARDNEIRVEYLGSSVQNLIATNFVIAAFLGGMGGALSVMALGHVEPEFAYWTRSGDFVFVAILSGHHSMLAVFVASTLLEIVRSFSSAYFPNTWQLVLGVFLLAVIRFLPEGIGSLWLRTRRRPDTREAAVAVTASVTATAAASNATAASDAADHGGNE
jgi:branched-chain amino acid transport system permease protein